MKKNIFLAILLLSAGTSFCQSFMHGVGITVMGNTKGQSGRNDFSLIEGFTYAPRYNFLETETFSVSAAIPLSFGVSVSSGLATDQYGNYTSSVGLIVNAPLIVNLNMGRGSTKENTSKFGYFVGAGIGYHYGAFITDGVYYDYTTGQYSDDTYSTSSFGPAANAGVRFGVGRKHKNIEVRLSFMQGLNDTKPTIFGIAGLFNF